MSAILTAGLFCLATNVYFEARSEDIEGQRAIAEVTWLKAIEVASEVMNRKTKGKLGPKVHHYHSKKVNPSWAKTMKPIAKIGNHIFYSS